MITEKDIDINKLKKYLAEDHGQKDITNKKAIMLANNLAALPDSVRRIKNATSNKSKQDDKNSTD